MLTIPNLLTFLRLIIVPFFILASFEGRFVAAFVLFVTAAVTDIFDGMIARRLNQRSRFGAILDPAADKTLMVSGYLFYTFSRIPHVQLPGWLTFVVFIRDVLIVAFAYLVFTRVKVSRFPPSVAGKTSTVLQAVTLASTIAVNGLLPRLLTFTEALFKVALVVTLFSGWDYMRRGQKLFEEGLAAAKAADERA